MLNNYQGIFARDYDDSDNSDPNFSPSMVNLIVIILAFIVLVSSAAGFLLFQRRQRQNQRRSFFPSHHKCSNHRRLAVTATPVSGRPESILIYEEKRDLTEKSSKLSPVSVPQIRITFPEEEDQTGMRKSGRVVVLRIADSGAYGMEPVMDDDLPPYQRSDAEKFQSLDLERMGGLREKQDRD